MAEELYFFKFDQERATEKLAPLLKKSGKDSYLYSMLEEEPFYSDEKLYFPNVLSKVKHSIDHLNLDELSSIYYWFVNKYYDKESWKDLNLDTSDFRNCDEILASFGLIMFHEIPSKTPVRNYHSVLSDYEHLSKNDTYDKKDTQQLLNFCDYGLVYSGLHANFLSNYYYEDYDDEDSIARRERLQAIQEGKNRELYYLAEKEFEKYEADYIKGFERKNEMNEYNRQEFTGSRPAYPPHLETTYHTINDVLSIAWLEYHFEGIIKGLGDYKGVVLPLHSY